MLESKKKVICLVTLFSHITKVSKVNNGFFLKLFDGTYFFPNKVKPALSMYSLIVITNLYFKKIEI
jgi:hypothetical protein